MIKVFGKEAQGINDGDVFIAKINYIEGRQVVELIPEKLICGCCGELATEIPELESDVKLRCINVKCYEGMSKEAHIAWEDYQNDKITHERYIEIRKMRGVHHKIGVYPFEITDHGIEIKPRA